MPTTSTSSSVTSSTCSLAYRDEPELMNTLRSHKTAINCVKFSSDDKKLVSGSDDGSIIFWNLEGDKPSETGLCYRLTGHKNAVNSVDFSQDGSFFVSSSKDTTVRLWKLNSTHHKPNEEPVVYKCHGLNVRFVGLNTEGNQFCTSSDDKTVKVWDAGHRNKFITSLLGHKNWVRCAKYCPKQSNLIASTGDDGLILIHDLRCTPKIYPLHSVSGKSNSHFTHLDWYPLSDFLVAVGSSDTSVRVYDIRQGNLVQFYESHESPVTSVAFHPNGKYLASSSSDSFLKIYDLLEGRVLFTIQAHSGSANCVQFNSSGDSFISAGHDKIIYLWKSNLLQDVPFDHHQGGDFDLSQSIINSCSPATKTATATTIPKRPTETKLKDYRQSPFLTKETHPHFAASKERSSPSHPSTKHFQDHNRGHHRHQERHESSPSSSSSPMTSSPELKLLQGIVEQMSNLTEAVSHIEQRLAVVESKLDSRQTVSGRR